jgi:DNA helicase IV
MSGLDSDELPTYEDLSEEQDSIYNLPLDGNYLVSGPPGTGKSVMALYRAEALTIDDRSPAILMFNQVLKQYTQRHAQSLDLADNVETFHRWVYGFWKRTYGGNPPKLGTDSWAYDWTAILSRFMQEPPERGSLADLLVDEGQDLPTAFYGLTRWLAANMTVFADENQQLHDHNSTLEEISKSIMAADHLHLRRNYRNSVEIARLARHFYCGSPTGLPEPPTRSWRPGPQLRTTESLIELVEIIARYARAHGNLRIGVTCRTADLQKKLFNRLNTRHVPVQAYISGDKNHKTLDFTVPGVKIINYRSLKGLQFDTLFVPELQLESGDPTSATVRMLFYVVFSRARNELYLSYTGTTEPAVVADIPHDVLART